MNLTEHFTIEEMTRSATAIALGIDNTPDAEATANLKNLCTEVLEPLRQWAGVPIIVSSGYRCPELNRAVGGTVISQHQKGEAADIRIPSITEGRRYLMFILENCCFDQLIWEHDRFNTHWIHVSCRRGKNRQTFVPKLLKR